MLITVERHTSADLRLWSELEEVDRLRGEELIGRGWGGRATAAIRDFAAAGRCYVSTSWGKDSVVVTHLAALAGVPLPVVHIVQTGPQQDLYQGLVRDEFRRRFPLDYHEIVVAPQSTPQKLDGHAPALDVGIARAKEALGAPRWIGGCRADESGVRAIRYRRGSVNSCWPIGHWSSADVFGWLAAHDLPVHPNYAMLGGGRYDREQLRVSILGGAKGAQFGRAEWEAEYYGDVLARLAAKSGDDPLTTQSR